MYIPLTFEGALQKCLFASSSTTEGFFVSGSQQWKFHWFTGSGQFVVDKGSIDNARIYVIGGGGGGATGQFNSIAAGGGGGGGVTSVSNAILYKGTYQIVVGKGGNAGSGSQSNGSSGVASSFIGPNLNLTASAGGGGTFGAGTTGGTSGNGFGGGLTSFTNGGGGGGAFGTGSNATSTKAGNGGIGLSLQVSEPIANSADTWGFGCGGGGYNAISTNQPGFSCNGTNYGNGGDGSSNGGDGANYYGMGGGAGSTLGGKGGSGSVIIQYPITDYCGNYFDRTGSCGCREITFDASDALDFYPNLSASYFYSPCGTNTYVSGSVVAYAPITVCANSGSFFVGPSGSEVSIIGILTGSLTQPQCTSGQKGYPETCITLAPFTSSCSSSFYTYFGYNDNGYAYWVGRNSSNISFTTFSNGENISGSKGGVYVCQSTIASNPAAYANIDRFTGAKCLVLNYTRGIGVSALRRLNWYDCGGTFRTQSFSFPGDVNFNFTASFALGSPWIDAFGGGGDDINYVSVHSDYTGSGLPTCGCP